MTKKQKQIAFISTVLGALFAGVPVVQGLLRTSEPTSPAAHVFEQGVDRRVMITGGSVGSINASTTSNHFVVQSIDPSLLDAFRQDAVNRERQMSATLELGLKLTKMKEEFELEQSKAVLATNPSVKAMLKDLAALQNYTIKRVDFDTRWAPYIESAEMLSLYVDKVLLGRGLASEEQGILKISENGLRSLQLVGASVVPYPAPRVAKPGFDCSKAEKWYETTICSDSTLAALDYEMVDLFKKLKLQPPPFNRVGAEQANWLKSVRNVCPDRECLVLSYKVRIDELRSNLAIADAARS